MKRQQSNCSPIVNLVAMNKNSVSKPKNIPITSAEKSKISLNKASPGKLTNISLDRELQQVVKKNLQYQ